MIVAGMAVLVVVLALSFKNSTNAGLLGVSMNSVLCESSDRLAHYRD
jgi:hypothetical protein